MWKKISHGQHFPDMPQEHVDKHIKELDFPIDENAIHEEEIGFYPGSKCVLCGRPSDFINKTPSDGGFQYGLCMDHIHESPESLKKYLEQQNKD